MYITKFEAMLWGMVRVNDTWGDVLFTIHLRQEREKERRMIRVESIFQTSTSVLDSDEWSSFQRTLSR